MAGKGVGSGTVSSDGLDGGSPSEARDISLCEFQFCREQVTGFYCKVRQVMIFLFFFLFIIASCCEREQSIFSCTIVGHVYTSNIHHQQSHCQACTVNRVVQGTPFSLLFVYFLSTFHLTFWLLFHKKVKEKI